MNGDIGSARHRSKDEAEIRQPIPRMFPKTEGQAKVAVIIILALLLSGIAYLVLRGINIFGE